MDERREHRERRGNRGEGRRRERKESRQKRNVSNLLNMKVVTEILCQARALWQFHTQLTTGGLGKLHPT